MIINQDSNCNHDQLLTSSIFWGKSVAMWHQREAVMLQRVKSAKINFSARFEKLEDYEKTLLILD